MKLFVWDFHGVLEQGNEKGVCHITNNILEQEGYTERLTGEDCSRMYGAKWHEFFKDLLPEVQQSEHLRLQERCFEYASLDHNIYLQYVTPTPHSHTVIKEISKTHHQIIISNTKPGALRQYLKAVGLSREFPAKIAFAVDAHGTDKTKKEVLCEYLDTQETEFDTIISIGDSPGDVELAKMHHGISYLYTHPGKPHKEVQADYKITDLREILTQI